MGSLLHVRSETYAIYSYEELILFFQDGKAAGQTVPHVHFHILPRKSANDRFGDRNDEIYPAIEKSEGDLASHLTTGRVDADEDRIARTPEDMEKEATWLRGFFK